MEVRKTALGVSLVDHSKTNCTDCFRWLPSSHHRVPPDNQERGGIDIRAGLQPRADSNVNRRDAYGFTVTLSCAVLQQHWNPPPPNPEISFATTSSTYSPGSLNVAVVVAFPAKAAGGGAWKSAFSTLGFSASNFTMPGPRNLLHVTVTAGIILAKAANDGGTLASSATHTASGTGS